MISVLPIRECGDACQAGELAFGPPPACPQTEPRYRLDVVSGCTRDCEAWRFKISCFGERLSE